MHGTTVVITGAASGIGKAIALGFLADGASVLGVDRAPDGLVDVKEAGGQTEVADVSQPEAVEAFVARAVQDTGRIDALFNNAGYGIRTRIEDLAEHEFEQLVAVHLFGAIYGMRAAIPVMRKQGHGRIVNTLSRAAEIAGPSDSAYSAAKAALWAATRSAACETADTDILVNGLIPGPTNTAIWGRPMPNLQPPEAVYPTAKMLATLPAGGPSGQVFWDEKPYPLMDPANPLPGGGPRP